MACDKHIKQLKPCAETSGLPDAVALWASGNQSNGHCPNCGAFLDRNNVCHNQENHKRVELARKIGADIRAAGGRAYFVGGYVRDTLRGQKSNDLDIAVQGLTQDQLCNVLAQYGSVKREVGEAYSVTKLNIYDRAGNFIEDYDFPLMRRDTYPTGEGGGYHDVVPEIGADVTLQEDADRRDISINAIYQDVLTGEYIDPVGGMEDIVAGRIRHTSDYHFPKSNERPLRLMQINARNPDLRIADETVEVCRRMTGQFDLIAQNQLRQQFYKLLVKGKKPSVGLQVLKDTGFLPLFPALKALDGCRQDPRYHPEGDALVHTGQVCDAMAAICDREGITGKDNEPRRFKLMMAALLHDAGKPETTVIGTDGAIVSPGHAENTEAAEAFMEQINVPQSMRPAVIALVNEHMAHISDPSSKSVKRLARRLGEVTESSDNPAKNATIDDLCLLMEADMSGRTADGSATPLGQTGNIAAIRRIAAQEQVETSKPVDILMGRHLISELGMNPKVDGKQMGGILKQARQAQDEGAFSDLDGALEWARRLI